MSDAIHVNYRESFSANGHDCIWGNCPVCWPEQAWDEYVDDFVERVLAGERVAGDDIYLRLTTGGIDESSFQKWWDEGVEAEADECAEWERLEEWEADDADISAGGSDGTHDLRLSDATIWPSLESPQHQEVRTFNYYAEDPSISAAEPVHDNSSSPRALDDGLDWDFVDGSVAESDCSGDEWLEIGSVD